LNVPVSHDVPKFLVFEILGFWLGNELGYGQGFPATASPPGGNVYRVCTHHCLEDPKARKTWRMKIGGRCFIGDASWTGLGRFGLASAAPEDLYYYLLD